MDDSRNELVDLTRQLLTYSRFWKRHSPSAESDKGVLVFGHPDMVHLEVLLRNILSMVPGSWQMTVIVGKTWSTDAMQLCQYLDENIVVDCRDEFFKENGDLVLNVYHNALSNIHFWTEFGWEKFLVVPADCLIIHPQFAEYIEHYDLLNTYLSFTLPSKMGDIGNSGLILRSMPQIKTQIDTAKDYVAIPKNIDKFMRQNSLNCLPEFFLYDKLINANCYYLPARSTIQLASLWVHCPWKLGTNWREFITRILAPRYNVVNEPSMKLFAGDSVECLGLVNMTHPPKKYPKNPWVGLLTGEVGASLSLDIDPRHLAKCLGFYGNIKLTPSAIRGIITLNKISAPMDLIRDEDLARRLVYANLNHSLKKYRFTTLPFTELDGNDAHNEAKRELAVFDLRHDRIPVDFNLKATQTILFVRDFAHLDECIGYEPLFFILPHQYHAKDKVKGVISISKYNYLGYYRHIPCLFLGPYANDTITKIHATLLQHSGGSRKSPFYLKQSEDHIHAGYLPDKMFQTILNGCNITTNNPLVSDYFQGRVLMINEFLSKRTKYTNNSWADLVCFIKHTYALEHKAQIILSVADMILSARQPVTLQEPVNNLLNVNKEAENTTPLETTRKLVYHHLASNRTGTRSANLSALYAHMGTTQYQSSGVRAGNLARPGALIPVNRRLRSGLPVKRHVPAHAQRNIISGGTPPTHTPPVGRNTINQHRDTGINSAARFGGYNDKITNHIPLVGRRKTRIPLSSYSAISTYRL